MSSIRQWRLNDLGWTWLISAVCAVCALLLTLECLQGLPILMEGRYGSIGIENGPGIDPSRLGTHRFPVPPQFQAALKAKPGDQLSFKSPGDRWRKLRLDDKQGPERVDVILWRDGKPLPGAYVLSAEARTLTPVDRFDYIARIVLAAAALLFAMLLGLKRADSLPHRLLSLCFVCLSFCAYMTFSFSAPGLALTVGRMGNLLSYPQLWFVTVYFARQYPPRLPRRLDRAMVLLLPAFGLLAALTSGIWVWFGLGHEAPLQGPLLLATMVGGELLIYACMIGGWRAARGEMRQRHAWLLLSFTVGSVPSMLGFMSAFDASIGGVPVDTVLALGGQMLMDIGLAYAVLRHRVFNFDFAISRAVVYSVISVVVLVMFGIIKWLAELWVHGGEHEENLLSDGAIALVIYLVFHQIHDRLEQYIERVFFHHWHQNERALRNFAREASHYSSSEMLLANLHKALERFSGNAGAVIYLKLVGGGYAQAFSTVAGAPHLLDADDGLVVGLRDRPAASRLSEHSTETRGALAFPMSHRGLLHGLVVMGHKRGGESYRPDEVDVLEFVVNQVGLDLQALIAAKLERDMERLSHEHERQREQIQLQRELLAELKPR